MILVVICEIRVKQFACCLDYSLSFDIRTNRFKISRKALIILDQSGGIRSDHWNSFGSGQIENDTVLLLFLHNVQSVIKIIFTVDLFTKITMVFSIRYTCSWHKKKFKANYESKQMHCIDVPAQDIDINKSYRRRGVVCTWRAATDHYRMTPLVDMFVDIHDWTTLFYVWRYVLIMQGF